MLFFSLPYDLHFLSKFPIKMNKIKIYIKKKKDIINAYILTYAVSQKNVIDPTVLEEFLVTLRQADGLAVLSYRSGSIQPILII